PRRLTTQVPTAGCPIPPEGGGPSGITVVRCSRYRPEKTKKFVRLPSAHEAGQKRLLRAIQRLGFQPASQWDHGRGRRCLSDGEGVEAQIPDWNARLVHGQQRGAPGCQRLV